MEWGSFFIGFLCGASVTGAGCVIWAYKAISAQVIDEHGEDYE